MPTPQEADFACGVGAGRMPTPQEADFSCGVGVSPALFSVDLLSGGVGVSVYCQVAEEVEAIAQRIAPLIPPQISS